MNSRAIPPPDMQAAPIALSVKAIVWAYGLRRLSFLLTVMMMTELVANHNMA
jgi:hypothetical protein